MYVVNMINLSMLNDVDRLGVAACRLNRWEWDEILGPKPEGFDDLPNFTPKQFMIRRKKPSKEDYVLPAMQAIRDIIGEANISRCWWKYFLGRSEEDWLRWYIGTYIKGGCQSNIHRMNFHSGSESNAPQAAENSAINQSCRRSFRWFHFKDDM